MDKSVLIQYADMKNRIKILRERIRKLEKEIDDLRETIASDVVSGGYGGTQHFKIEGVPDMELKRKQRMLETRISLLKAEELKLLELTNEAEEYIQSIEPIELRNMFDFYYIQNMGWAQVAYRMNCLYPKRKVAYTEENCRQRNKRFFEKNNEMSRTVTQK